MISTSTLTFYELLSLCVLVVSILLSAGLSFLLIKATNALVKVTTLLAAETANMAQAMSTAQVVLTLKRHSLDQDYIEVFLENTGTATAYDILIEHTANNKDGSTGRHAIPFHKMSVLKPKDVFRSCIYTDHMHKNEPDTLANGTTLFDCVFTLNISWAHSPGNNTRHSLNYNLSVKELGDVGKLDTPLTAIAKSLERLENHVK